MTTRRRSQRCGPAAFTQVRRIEMYIVLFLDQSSYEFNVTLHPTRASAEAAYKALLRRFEVKPLPGCGGALADDCGEAPHVYQIAADGKLGEEIDLSGLATATA